MDIILSKFITDCSVLTLDDAWHILYIACNVSAHIFTCFDCHKITSRKKTKIMSLYKIKYLKYSPSNSKNIPVNIASFLFLIRLCNNDIKRFLCVCVLVIVAQLFIVISFPSTILCKCCGSGGMVWWLVFNWILSKRKG